MTEPNPKDDTVVRETDLIFEHIGWLDRRHFAWVLLAVGTVAMLAFLTLAVGLIQERNTRSTNIHKLACAVIAPYSDTIPYVKDVRAKYHCPKYDPAIRKRLLEKAAQAKENK